MTTRPPRRREILRDRKAQLSLAKSARLTRMTWSGKGGTFTLGPGGPAIEVMNWSIETDNSEPTMDSYPVGVGVLKVQSSPFKIYQPEEFA